MIYYASRTGNIRAVVARLALPNQSIEGMDASMVDAPFLLFTYTDGLGQIPATVAKFMEVAHPFCKGLIVSGNSNFGQHFCAAADKLHQAYGIPILRKIELRGFTKDDEAIQNYYKWVINDEETLDVEQ